MPSGNKDGANSVKLPCCSSFITEGLPSAISYFIKNLFNYR